MKKCNTLSMVAWILVVVGALNWGLVGFFQWDLVRYLLVDLAGSEVAARVVYALVGVAGVVALGQMAGGCDKK